VPFHFFPAVQKGVLFVSASVQALAVSFATSRGCFLCLLIFFSISLGCIFASFLFVFFNFVSQSLAVHGVEASSSVVVLGPRVRVSMEEDFLHTYGPKVIFDLNSVVGNGTFIVSATIIGVVPGEDWWYPACKCHKSVTADSGSYYCGRCVKHVFQMIPSCALFPLFSLHLLMLFMFFLLLRWLEGWIFWPHLM
jgi:hypothetical protein